MGVKHLEIRTSTDYSIENTVKIGGDVVSMAYFTRNIIKIVPSPGNNYLMVVLPGDNIFLLTHDQANEAGEILIVDSVNNVAPTSLFDLASKINALIKF